MNIQLPLTLETSNWCLLYTIRKDVEAKSPQRERKIVARIFNPSAKPLNKTLASDYGLQIRATKTFCIDVCTLPDCTVYSHPDQLHNPPVNVSKLRPA